MSALLNEIHFDSIDSTSAYLKREWKSLENFTFVSASFQTNGKGRGERVWISESNANLLFSLLLKDKNLTEVFPYLSLFSAYLIATALKQLGLNNVSIKWPNDVYVNDKKICGILLEGSLPSYLVIGVGINVNQLRFDKDLRVPATSISIELGKEINIESFKEIIFNEFNKITSLAVSDTEKIIKEINKLSYLNNKKVKAEINGNEEEVFVKGINNDCSLKVTYNNSDYDLKIGEINLL